jgi:antitoxin ParD1/3/4
MSVTVELEEDDQAFVTSLVASGRYGSPDEVIHQAVQLVRLREERRAELHAAIARGVADADAGRVKPADEVFDRLIAKYEAMAQAAE